MDYSPKNILDINPLRKKKKPKTFMLNLFK